MENNIGAMQIYILPRNRVSAVNFSKATLADSTARHAFQLMCQAFAKASDISVFLDLKHMDSSDMQASSEDTFCSSSC